MGMLIGSAKDVTEAKLKRGIVEKKSLIDVDKAEKDVEDVVEPGKLVSEENIGDISDEELAMLDKIRLREDPYVVYMQSDVSFYDYFYNKVEKVDELTIAAHQLRRMYPHAEDYLYALDIRAAYMNMILDRDYDNDERAMERDIRMGKIWVPAEPRLSRNDPDYDAIMAGVYVDFSEYDREREYDPTNFYRILKNEYEKMVEEGVDFTWKNTLATDPFLLQFFKQEYGSKSRGKIEVSDLNDTERLRRELNSIYGDKKNDADYLFSNTPERLIEEERNLLRIDLTEVTRKIFNYEEIDDEVRHDPNEMVVDGMNRVISRKDKIITDTSKLLARTWDVSEIKVRRGLGGETTRGERELIDQEDRKARKIKPSDLAKWEAEDEYKRKHGINSYDRTERAENNILSKIDLEGILKDIR